MPHEIKSILTMLNRPADLAAVLGWANRIAKDFDATADGAFLRYEMATDAYLFTDGFQYYPSDLPSQIQQASAEAEQVARDEFEGAGKQNARCRLGSLSVLSDGLRGGLARLSRHYDLALTHLPESGNIVADETVLAELLLEGGVPVFAAPRTATCESPLQTALVSWDASLEASRALRAALPFLKECRRVNLRCISPKSPRTVDLDAASRYLRLHGVEIDASTLKAEEKDAGEAILTEAERGAADFIVMGAFGHKPWREQLFGGVTHDVVRASRKPLLLAH